MYLSKVTAVNCVRFFIHLQGLGSSQLADHLVNEINQGPYYVKTFLTLPSISQVFTNFNEPD